MYDYIVVGGGSAGCTIASRLSEDPGSRVLLLEQGSSDWSPYIHMPVTYYKTAKSDMLTRYRLEPQEHQGGITPEIVQGRVLGGGSSVNAMVYMRGVPYDYDTWEKEDGCTGWGYKDVLPYFKKAENNERFSGEVHGSEGPLHVSDQRHTHYLTKAWIKAAQELGINFNPDFNSGNQAGVGLYQVTMKDGLRCSAAAAYLRPARNRKNLTVKTKTKALKILVENNRAIGVEYLQNGNVVRELADQEVIVCSGAVGSPHLLLCSGIGAADHLREVGVPVVHDLPGVGQNLQDHFDIFLIYELNGPHSYDKYKKFRWQILAGLQYALCRNGPVTSNICEGGLCWYGAEDDPLPTLQYHFLPGAGVEEGSESVPSGNGCTTNVYQMRPRSRGYIKLKSPDPTVFPRVDPRYLSEQYDVDCLAEGVRIAQEILQQKSISKFIDRPYRPGKILKTKEERIQLVKETGQGALHPSGACRMGTDDMAVVDLQLRVRGIDGLRVADSSIMPRVVSGNLNAPTIMIGERAADFIRGNKTAVPA